MSCTTFVDDDNMMHTMQHFLLKITVMILYFFEY